MSGSVTRPPIISSPWPHRPPPLIGQFSLTSVTLGQSELGWSPIGRGRGEQRRNFPLAEQFSGQFWANKENNLWRSWKLHHCDGRFILSTQTWKHRANKTWLCPMVSWKRNTFFNIFSFHVPTLCVKYSVRPLLDFGAIKPIPLEFCIFCKWEIEKIHTW